MAIFTLTNPSVLDGLTGTAYYTTLNTSVVAFNYPATGVTVTMTGSFQYSGGDVTSGVLNGVSYTQSGSVLCSITGLNVSLSQYIAAASISPDAVGNLFYGGDDQFFGSVFGEVLTARGGNDTVIALDGDDTVYGGDGNDDINGNVGRDVVDGGAGADTVRGGKDNDTVYGGTGDDPHVNGNIGNDIVYGGDGNDTCYGGQDNDTLYGEAGNDLLSGDLGNDVMFGGAGADRFVLRAGSSADWVGDFNAAAGDRIQLAPGTAYTVVSISGQVAIDIGGGDVLGLAGITSGFTADWIVYA